MSRKIKINRGLDLNLKGGLPEGAAETTVVPDLVAVYPGDFPGFTPKLSVKEGDTVECGEALLHDKINGKVNLVSPVSGKVKAVVRGERRKIIRVEVELAGGNSVMKADVSKISTPEEIKNAMMQTGVWALMRQRPYDIVPDTEAVPVNVFVTGFDSAPLAPSLADAVAGKGKELSKGVEWLAKLTSGKVFISTRPSDSIEVPQLAEHVIVDGPHPSGNAGVQAANIAPVNKGETIWTLDIETLCRIGQVALTGAADWSARVAVVGSEVIEPKMVTTVVGAALSPIIKEEVADNKEKHLRIISGNVLTGVKCVTDGFLHYPYRQLTVIPEGDDVDEFMGWASMSPNKMSQNRSFFSSLLRGRKFAPDARLNGGRRAMIMSEQYDKVMPMDILPEYLIKAILARDIDQMERLGIYEVAPEDFALCEYVDPSKLELQRTVREGLDYLRKELE